MGPSHLQNGLGKLRPMQAQLRSSCEQPAHVLLPVQAQPQLLEGLPQAPAGVQRLAAGHIQWPLEDVALYTCEPGLLLKMTLCYRISSLSDIGNRK